jgi:hypothetical protein
MENSIASIAKAGCITNVMESPSCAQTANEIESFWSTQSEKKRGPSSGE